MSDDTPKANPETPDTPTDSFPPVPAATAVAAPAAPVAPAAEPRTSKLNKVLAWVGIVAGIVFIVATIFFSGFILGAHSGGGHHGGWHKHHRGQDMSEFREGRHGPGGGMWHPMFPGGPGWQGPGGQGPGGPGPQAPGQPAPTQPGR
ncbi:hypothetical protein EB75_21145 [Mycobacterium sp. ST-F2]|uniref:hypothetical protein n=1 Tax=Mycobacterium sp. ST-F2 TaxID=1490484 RepID=UPI00093CE95D|nr:hypothetical protein [Mycobacterium sp. ST-F2]OKH80259.1 hypothetical protein EB75_21145 [Mycobacterium sp. ST-F2]